MTTLTHTNGMASAARPTRSTGLFANLRTAWTSYRMYRETYEQLNALSDRDLADLGISRVQIADVAAEAAYGTK